MLDRSREVWTAPKMVVGWSVGDSNSVRALLGIVSESTEAAWSRIPPSLSGGIVLQVRGRTATLSQMRARDLNISKIHGCCLYSWSMYPRVLLSGA